MKRNYLNTVPVLALLFISIISLSSKGHADTVKLKNGGNIKGIVVEDYVDRIVFSTIDGEKVLLKSDIIDMEYDEPVDNLIKLGDSASRKEYHKTALKYYTMAQEINPSITALNDKIYHTETTIYKTREIRKREYLDLKNEIISGQTPSFDTKIDPQEDIRRILGIYVSKKEGRFYIDNIYKRSPFKKAGARKGDAITAIWSKLCSYMTFDELHKIIANPEETMVWVTIERSARLHDNMPFGAELIMKWEGATIDNILDESAAGKTGLKAGDIIVAINGQSIRYTPLKKVIRLLRKRGPKTNITIQRKLSVFKLT